MKLSVALSTLALFISLAVDAAVVPEFDLAARHQSRGRGGFGGFGGGNQGTAKTGQGQQNKQGGQGNNNTGGGSNSTGNSNTSVAATSTTATAAAATSSVAATGEAIVGAGNVEAAQSSLTLDPAVVMTGLEQNGQAVQEAGQVPSLTSSNNFINFCLTQNLPLTNGQQVTSGSCNQTPMGVILATSNMPSAKFVFPTNGATISANQAFTVSMAISNLETGNFVNAQANYYAAPSQVNSNGDLVGHSHVVIEQLDSLTQTTPTDPNKFAFFKGLNDAAVNGVLTADVTSGLPAGVYRLSSINTAANHQPALVAIAQHGSLDDQVYFTVSDSGAASNSTSGFSDSSTATSSAVTDSTATSSAVTATSTATSSTSDTGAGAGNSTATGQGQNQQQQQKGKNGQGQQQGKIGGSGQGNRGRGRRDVLARLS